MVITKRDLTAAAQRAVKRLRAEADAALVEAGRAAKRRQRRRAVKATLNPGNGREQADDVGLAAQRLRATPVGLDPVAAGPLLGEQLRHLVEPGGDLEVEWVWHASNIGGAS